MSLDRFFTILKNGAWHSVDELSEELGLTTRKLTELSRFLSDRGLITYEDKTERIRIKPVWKLLLPEGKEPQERKATLATFIIPPESSIQVQSTQISNLSGVEMEVSLRIDNKIREVAVKV